MTSAKIESCIKQGLCTWDQVRATLANARLSEAEIARFTAGRLALGPYAEAMLRRLIESGEVPTEPVE